MLELCYVLHKLSSHAVYFHQQYCSQTNVKNLNHSYKQRVYIVTSQYDHLLCVIVFPHYCRVSLVQTFSKLLSLPIPFTQVKGLKCIHVSWKSAEGDLPVFSAEFEGVTWPQAWDSHLLQLHLIRPLKVWQGCSRLSYFSHLKYKEVFFQANKAEIGLWIH